MDRYRQRKSRSRQYWIGVISVGYIFPGSPVAPGGGHQRVSGANPQLADCLRYHSRQGASGLNAQDAQ